MDGDGLRSSVGKGCVVERSVFFPYKLSRPGYCFPRLEEILEVAVWRSCPGSDRQHYGDALSEQTRRDQVQVLGVEGQGDYSLVSEREGLHCQQYIAQDRTVSRRIASLGFELRILADWSAPLNHLLTTG